MAAMWSKTFASLALLTTAGCLTGPASPAPSLQPGEMPILWQRAGHDDRIRRPFQYIAHDARALARLPLDEVPVDFKSQMVLIAAAGTVRSKDIEIRIQRVCKQGSEIRPQVLILNPTTQSSSPPRRRYAPYHIVVVPRSDLNVEGFSSMLPKGAFVSGGPD